MSILRIRDNQGNIQEIPCLRGPKGEAGADGKSAYEYAKDAGYNGTEEEFADKLANNSGTGCETSQAIIDVTELPTENINEEVFYRLLSGSFVSNQFTQPGWIAHCVDNLPETGELAVTGDLEDMDTWVVTAYYNLADEGVYCYVNDILGSIFGVPAGWYPFGILVEVVGYTFGGVIANIADDPMDDSFYVLLERVIYSYKDGTWTSQKVIGYRGTGHNAEIFNHPSNRATGLASHAEGWFTYAEGDSSHAEGSDSRAEGFGSHAEGNYSHAEGWSSHAEGESSHAEGYASHAEGYVSHAEGQSSHAEGYASHAEGYASHAEGEYSHAEGAYSHAEGLFSHAVGRSQHVQGEYNVTDPNYDPNNPNARGKYAHIVGNGTNESDHSNAHTLSWDGTAWFATAVKVGGTNQDDAEELATKEYVDTLVSNVPGGNGSGAAIIDVAELPTENIREDIFYRLVKGVFVCNRVTYSGWIAHCVDGLPEVGELAVSGDLSDMDTWIVTAYYNTVDGEVYCYVDDTIGSIFGVPAGWYPFGALCEMAGFVFGGVITDIKDDPDDGSIYVLLEATIYSHKDGVWTSSKTVATSGEGFSSVVLSSKATATGDYAMAYGWGRAEGNHSFAGGEACASGEASFALGSGTCTADALGSFAQCSQGYAGGSYSFARGSDASATGDYSFAQGYNVNAQGEHQFAWGKNNVRDYENKYLCIIGNGERADLLSNAHTLDWDGNAWFQGTIKLGGTGQDDAPEEVATKSYVESLITGAIGGSY